MRSGLFAMALLPLPSYAYNPFRATQQTLTISQSTYSPQAQPTGISEEFNPGELLRSKSRRPDVFDKAMVELKRLEHEPICHRVAARLLVNNCRGLEELNEHNYQFNGNEEQRHHVDSFTISLTTCELERMALNIPGECSPFTSTALFQHSRDGREKLDVSPGQVNECLRGIAQDPRNLQTWISYRDKALLFCQAARLDLDKDQAIRLHQKLTQIMEDFLAEANGYMSIMKMNMEHNARASNSFFKKAMNDAEIWGAKVQDSFQSVSNNAKDVDAAMRAILGSSKDVTQMMKSFVKMVLEGTASIANEHEKALDVTTNRFESRMVNIHDMVTDTELKLAEVKSLVVEAFGPMIVSLLERQDDLEKKTQDVLSAVINATELLQTHNQKLDQATTKTSVITGDLEKAAAAAKSWSENLNVRNGFADWSIRIVGAVGAPLIGNIGLPTSLARNFLLFFGGLTTGEAVVRIRHLWEECCWIQEYLFPGADPTSPNIHTTALISRLLDPSQIPHLDMS